MPLKTVGGKLLTVSGKLSTGEDCCCTPKGACCEEEDGCNEKTQAECEDAGGEYQGDGTKCDSIECLALRCDRISGGRSKCGFNPPRLIECVPPYTDFGYASSWQFFDGCSAEIQDCATSAGDTVSYTKYYLTRTINVSGASANPGCNSGAETCGSYTLTQTYNPLDCSVDSEGGDESAIVDCVTGDPPAFSHPITADFALTDEYTTAAMISLANSELPEFPGTFDSTYCLSAYEITAEEDSYSVVRFRYKFTFSPSSEDRILNWTGPFLGDLGGHLITPGPPMSEAIPAGATESSVYMVYEPSSNGGYFFLGGSEAAYFTSPP